MYNSKKTKNCNRFKAIDQNAEPWERSDIEGDCKNCKFFNSRNCSIEAADEIDPLPGLWS